MLIGDLSRAYTEGQDVTLRGRVVAVRRHGKITFADIVDHSGKIQLLGEIDEVVLGDVIEADGVTETSRKGEPSVRVSRVKIHARCLEKVDFTGRSRYPVVSSMRHMGLLVDPALVDFFACRSSFVDALRMGLKREGFKEFDTGYLQDGAGISSANLFETTVAATGEAKYLRLTSEIRLKQLLCGGFDRVFELGKSFRNEGRDASHVPEFTQLELYMAYANYGDIMDLVEKLVAEAVEESFGSLSFGNPTTLDFSGEWPRATVLELGRKKWGMAFDLELDESSLLGLLSEGDSGVGQHRVWWHLIKKRLLLDIRGPMFVTDFPDITPLAKVGGGGSIEKAALVLGGQRVADIYTDENDPVEVERRIKCQYGVDPDPVLMHVLRCGLPPSAGCSIGPDRILMTIGNALGIIKGRVREAILFPPDKGA